MADGQFHVMKQGGALRRGASDDPDDGSGTSRLRTERHLPEGSPVELRLLAVDSRG